MELLLRTLSSQPPVSIWQSLFILDFVFSSVPLSFFFPELGLARWEPPRLSRPSGSSSHPPCGPTFRFSRTSSAPVPVASCSAPSDLLAPLSSLPCSLPSGLSETLLLLALPHDIWACYLRAQKPSVSPSPWRSALVHVPPCAIQGLPESSPKLRTV